MNESLNSITYNELCRIEGINHDFISAIVEYGIVQPKKETSQQDWIFETTSVYWIKKASRLHTDLEIDWLAVALVIDLLQQKNELENENQRLTSLLQRFIEKPDKN